MTNIPRCRLCITQWCWMFLCQILSLYWTADPICSVTLTVLHLSCTCMMHDLHSANNENGDIWHAVLYDRVLPECGNCILYKLSIRFWGFAPTKCQMAISCTGERILKSKYMFRLGAFSLETAAQRSSKRSQKKKAVSKVLLFVNEQVATHGIFKRCWLYRGCNFPSTHLLDRGLMAFVRLKQVI